MKYKRKKKYCEGDKLPINNKIHEPANWRWLANGNNDVHNDAFLKKKNIYMLIKYVN